MRSAGPSSECGSSVYRYRRRYVYLVDSAGRVRWRGSGPAEGTEVDALLRCTEELLAEADGVTDPLEQVE